MYDFDKVYTKREPGNCKWDVEKGCIALSVADMDFASPPEVTKALIERVSTGLYGYEMMTERDYQAIIDWRFKRHGEVIKREHLMATPGVLNTMRAALYALTNEGDKVIVMPPLHTPSITSASMRGRVCVEVLMNDDGNGYYTLNYEGIEQAFKDGAKVLMFCSPSNPSGRVWTKEELERLAKIVIKYNGYVIADEIHADIVYKGHKFISLRLIEGMEDRSVCVFSPSKSFNFGGFHIGSVVVKDDNLRKKIKDILYETGNVCGRPTAMSICAQTAAYTKGGAWLDELLEYLQGNIDFVCKELEGTPLKAYKPESTILMWIDCSALKLTTEKYNELMKKAGIMPDPGHYYWMDNHKIDAYKGLQDHIRINIGAPRATLKEALNRLKSVLL